MTLKSNLMSEFETEVGTTDYCGAITDGEICAQVKLRSGRCKIHGGLSTGPRTARGKLRASLNGIKSGSYTADVRYYRKQLRTYCHVLGLATPRLKVGVPSEDKLTVFLLPRA